MLFLFSSIGWMIGVDVKKNVIVTISSDKGLCGGINSTAVKMSKALKKLNSGMYFQFFFHLFLDAYFLSLAKS